MSNFYEALEKQDSQAIRLGWRLSSALNGRIRTLQQQEIERLQGLARIDYLTGLYNRRGMEEEVGRELARARREQKPISLIYLDVDNFKAGINDAYGHAAGDEALREVSRRLRLITREGEHVGRVGGDEIAILLYGASAEEADIHWNRLVDNSRYWEFSHNGARISLGISAGKATCEISDLAGMTVGTLFDMADQDLYRTKRGKNGGKSSNRDSPSP